MVKEKIKRKQEEKLQNELNNSFAPSINSKTKKLINDKIGNRNFMVLYEDAVKRREIMKKLVTERYQPIEDINSSRIQKSREKFKEINQSQYLQNITL